MKTKIKSTFAALIFASHWSAQASAPNSNQKSQFIEQRDVGLVRDALGTFYSDCGFYPDDLEKLFKPTEQQQSCLHGNKQPPLKPTPQNQEAIRKLTYAPFGYDDFELSIRLYWTRDP